MLQAGQQQQHREFEFMSFAHTHFIVRNEIQLSRNAYENSCFIAVRYVHVRGNCLYLYLLMYLYLHISIALSPSLSLSHLRALSISRSLSLWAQRNCNYSNMFYDGPSFSSNPRDAFGQNVSRYIIATFSRR